MKATLNDKTRGIIVKYTRQDMHLSKKDGWITDSLTEKTVSFETYIVMTGIPAMLRQHGVKIEQRFVDTPFGKAVEHEVKKHGNRKIIYDYEWKV